MLPSSPTRGSPLYPSSPPQNYNLPLSLTEVDEEQDSNSVISSRVTELDARSEGNGDVAGPDFPSGRRRSQRDSLQPPFNKHSQRGSLGETQADTFSRPSTAASSNAKPWSGLPSSRRGFTPSIRNRPTSSASRTHVPSLASHAFYRPMSSAKLQAQRSKVKEEHEMENSRLRLSTPVFGSDLGMDDLYTRRMSVEGSNRRDTFSDADGMVGAQYGNSILSPTTTQHMMQSQTSVSPLHSPEHDVPQTAESKDSNSKEGKPASSSTGADHQKAIRMPQAPKEKNFQHFPGNTNFCCWGRWQTANDLPMNYLTALLVFLPAGLFFGFS